MPTPALKLNVLIGHPSYGGNGGISSEHPDIREWACETILKMKADPRIGEIHVKTIADTPITMVRNRFVDLARQNNCHLLLMVDSDQSPNCHRGEPWFRPFWDVAFEEIYAHYGNGPLVIGAPYGGPPNGGENVYVFQWDNDGNRGDETAVRLEQFTRAESARMHGITEVAALPTGMILYDMRCFDLIEPSGLSRQEVLERFERKEMTLTETLAALNEGYFYYEWKNSHADEKASTEDVQNTRDISLAGQAKLGYNPVRCAWDSWIGHWKPWNVGRPRVHSVEHISATFRRVVESGETSREVLMDLGKDFRELINSKEIHRVVPPPTREIKIQETNGHGPPKKRTATATRR